MVRREIIVSHGNLRGFSFFCNFCSFLIHGVAVLRVPTLFNCGFPIGQTGFHFLFSYKCSTSCLSNLKVHCNLWILQINAKYDKEIESDAKQWIELVIGEQVEWGTEDDTPGSAFADGLKSGEVLCKYDVILNIIDLAQPA